MREWIQAEWRRLNAYFNINNRDQKIPVSIWVILAALTLAAFALPAPLASSLAVITLLTAMIWRIRASRIH